MRFHPAVALAYVGLLVLVVLLFSHPLGLVALAVVVGAGLVAAGALRSWWGSLKLLWPAALLIVVLNPLLVREGATVLWQGPRLPLVGYIDVSLEALVFGLLMAFRLLLLTGAFLIYQRLVEPDDLLALVGRALPRAGVMLALAARLVPATAATYREVRLAQAARGVDFQGRGRLARFRHHLLLVKGLLLSSLERALDLAEAMQARAFGSGPRTAFVAHLWRPRDT
ncbi:MAG: energy-coupling factor transporter transmembrane protein EcfT, partial [Firmicutes bacterium]|nr:energy-coupling factor transporter transmembrane protein EcfT [Bacillota bacterium]